MKSQARRIIEHYHKACMALLKEFVERYWDDTQVEYFVIGVGNITGVVCVADIFIDWEEVEYCILDDVKPEVFWAWRQYLEMMDYKAPINHRTFFMSYPTTLCTKAKTTTKKRSSTTKPSTGSRKP